ncbi:hypothetical protein PSA7680_03317 [Pseudoruegeria aquimaris]|uniref:DUF304 domain-containing protein n=1 Tax=Pseudoruegeria aquimaris TaxID=393663 RepID=A0A1Y5TL78_9RHOB|nr:hypothetical protein [Pseudoruegeria aquimaris]SLN62904.1 hypothetical protein PSA7680_03317 [Pseudoruegeria aquimaris]
MPDPDLIPNHRMVPEAPLAEGEAVIASFPADRATYVRDHAAMAALAMGGGMIVLWLLGNPHVWTGAVGGLAAIAVRGFYLASEDLSARWDLTDRRLLGPMGRSIPLSEITRIRALGSAVQIITRGGDKHLIKYQPDKDATRTAIARAAGLATEAAA